MPLPNCLPRAKLGSCIGRLEADSLRSVERALRSSSPNQFASDFEGLVGYQAFADEKAAHIDGVVAEGKYGIAFHLEKPDATFPYLLTLHAVRPTCKSAGDSYVDTWLPCGAGPFKLEPGGWVPGTSLRLVRHTGYFRAGLPYLDAVEWSFNMQEPAQRMRLERGELDFDVNRRAASDIQGLARKLNLLDEKIDDVGNLLRGRK